MSYVTREEFEALRAKVGEHEALLKDHSPVLRDHDGRLASLEGVVERVNAELRSLATWRTRMDAAIEDLDDGVRQAALGVLDVKKEVGGLRADIGRIQSAVTPLVLHSSRSAELLERMSHQLEAVHAQTVKNG